MTGVITGIAGALVRARGTSGASLYERALVGRAGLLGEVVRVDGDCATVQVFEETIGLSLEEPLSLTGAPMSIELGPGLLGSVLDGVGRPLELVATEAGSFIKSGTSAATLDRGRTWRFVPSVGPGAEVGAGDVIGEVEERPGLMHRIMVPPDIDRSVVEAIEPGELRVDQPVGRLAGGRSIGLSHRWPIRLARPTRGMLPGDRPLITGQRVFDFLFPVAEGGTVCVPGGFGTGKTVIEQSLAKLSNADVVVYIGCGERGNEMADLLTEFPGLEDPRTGHSLMDRTIMIVNTSNMPVAARDASVYLGMTIAEYFRDMGYRVALMADSLSRWAEALRELGARLSQMPGEEGYPTSLPNLLARLYERSGRAKSLGAPERVGAVTFISAISPPGGDFSEPVTQASLRVVGAMWALDANLAHQRQFPAVDWETSYSLYADATAPWWTEHGGADWSDMRTEIFRLLQRDRELRDIASLVGPEALDDEDRLVLQIAELVRQVFLAQSAYDRVEAYSPPKKTWVLARLILDIRRLIEKAVAAGTAVDQIDFSKIVDGVKKVQQSGHESVEDTASTCIREIERSLGDEP